MPTELPPSIATAPASAKDPFGEGAAAARARRLRSLVIALALVAFVAIVFVVSVIKLSSGHGL